MDEVWTLILLSLAMLVGCYLAGSVPLAFSMSEEKLKLVTVLGAGLLVGTALAVIIPEGVHALVAPPEGKHDHHHHEERAAAVVDSKLSGAEVGKQNSAAHAHAHSAGADVISKSTHDHSTDVHGLIGVALVLGFVFMLLVDQIGGNIHRSSGDNGSGGQARSRMTATLGLVVHAAADGVALGAAASTSHTHVEMIVFVAIMLHKAPAAFGLVTFLLHEGLERNRIRKHLGVFALSAPLLSIVTYFGLSQRSKDVLSDVNATGLAMLFSGGTFLYVATVHILPELARMDSSTSSSSLDGIVITRSMEHNHKGFSRKELLVMVIGCLLPLVLAVGHSH